MRILVTGGCGFIGSHICDLLAKTGHEAAVVDNLSTGRLENLNPSVKFYKLDIRSEELADVFSEFRPEAVFHEAAQISVPDSIKHPQNDADINISGTVRLLECCRAAGTGKVIFASSAAVYGTPKYLPLDEFHKCMPLSFYGLSKLCAEIYIKLYSKLFGFKYAILRYANVYGPRQDPAGEGGVVSVFADKLKSGGVPVIYGDGEQTRDFVYVKDVAAANLAALEHCDNDIINVGSGIATSVNGLFKIMKGVYRGGIEADHAVPREGDIYHSYFNIGKMRKILDFTPGYSLEQGLAEMRDVL